MTYLTSTQVIERYKISQMSLWRWTKSTALNFPKPMVINRRKLWNAEELAKWEREQAKGAA
ncbi:helix-turn-helix domain-containing protein [Shinella sumterensis]|uniref:DNA-binding protein n=1 Tax=Shinella sumterensis TaxID=1967501 RepID=UPI00106EA216|nr:DNA-binding protein [Shinella sumterensis]MCD1267062.1 DNA-binding protein [Shinella sumterensis]TFE94829.1 helix-turn-helix domain-containing protein [Shinella sumterensis]